VPYFPWDICYAGNNIGSRGKHCGCKLAGKRISTMVKSPLLDTLSLITKPLADSIRKAVIVGIEPAWIATGGWIPRPFIWPPSCWASGACAALALSI
jgi:hypothetical protein